MATDEERGGPARQIGEMASRALSTVTLSEGANLPATTSDERALFPRLDDASLNALAEVAYAPLPALVPIDEQVLTQSLAVLDSALPRRNSDYASGRMMLAAYKRKLGHMPKEQIDYLCNAILERCRWFPTIAECLEIAAEWQRADAREKARARNLIDRERQARMDDAHRRLKFGDDVTQAEVDSWPERWKEIAATAGLLYRDPERRFQIRPRAIKAPAEPPPEPEAPPTTEEPDDERTLD